MGKMLKVLGLAGILLAGSSWGIDFDSILYLKGGSYISASAAGDVNGDSLDDLITNIVDGTGNGYQGSGSIYFGPLQDSIANKVLLSSPGSRYVFNVGDVNKDGYSDVIVKGGDAGVRVYFGGTNMDTLPDIIFKDSSFTNYPQGIGDFNKDGYDDIAIPFTIWSAYYTSIYFGGASMDTTRDVTLRGGFTTTNYWKPIELNGNINGDNYSDVVTLIQDTVTNHDTLLIYYGDSIPNNTPDVSLVVDSVSDFSIRGDVNGDGYSDIIVASGSWNTYVFLGGASFNTTKDITLPHGIVVSCIGDVNGDNYDDLFISTGGKNGYLYLGDDPMDTTADWELTKTATGDNIGVLGTAGDIDNDGRSEFFTGKYQRSGPTEPPYLEVWHCNVGVEEKSLSVPKSSIAVSSNPFSQSTVIKYQLSEKDKKIDIKIYDVTGKLVREILINANTCAVTWDGKDNNGRNLPDGTYFCRLNTSSGVQEVKITKITSTGRIQ